MQTGVILRSGTETVVLSLEVSTLVAKTARIRLASPSDWSDSWIANGTRFTQAPIAAGTET